MVASKCGSHALGKGVHGPLIPTPWRKRIASHVRHCADSAIPDSDLDTVPLPSI